MSNRTVIRLKALLEVERKALLAGDLAAVGDLITEKEELASDLGSAPPTELKSMSDALARNALLLAAARDGVGDVLATLRKQRAARTSLSTYDSDGKASQISRASSATERRF